ncbi:MAG: hypothetical protein KDE22_10075 [Rhodobacterales bacterium]|nr:hypothetical protein [Rhodobacterales bacterium]
MTDPNGHLTHGPHTPLDPDTLNRIALLRVVLIVVVALFFASFLPPGQVAMGASLFLLFAALGSAVSAVALHEHPFARRLTRWDEAAMAYGVSLLLQIVFGTPGAGS